MLHIDIDKDVVNFSEQGIAICSQLQADFNSGTVKAIEAYLPASTVAIEGAKTILTTAIASLKTLHDIADDDGFKGRLLTLSTSLTNLQTSGQHEWGVLVNWVQTVFNHWKKKNAA